MPFPFLQGLPAEIGEKFKLGSTLWDKGAKPYIAYKSGASVETTIGSPQWEAFQYDNAAGKRHPVSVLGLEVKCAGSNGTLRKAEVTVQFPTIDVVNSAPWIDFFRIGNTAAVIWGWSYAGSGMGTFGEADRVYNNVEAWRGYVSGKGYMHEMLVGIMSDFELSTNNNGTVTVVFHVTSPNELPGTLKISKPDGQNTGAFASDKDSDRMAKVMNALKYGGIDDKQGAAKAYFVKSSINVTRSWVPDFTVGNSDEPYAKLDAIVDSVINNLKTLSNGKTDFSIDITNVVARGHKNMISISDNVIFPNAYAPGFRDTRDEYGNRVITPSAGFRQDLTIIKPGQDINFPNIRPIVVSGPGVSNTYPAFKAGFIKNVYMQTTWVSETMRNCDNVYQWMEKLCDELNYASCGLMDLGMTETAKADGTLIYTMVDFNLTPKDSAAEKAPFELDPRQQGSSVLELKLTTDLPKAMAAQAVLGPTQARENTGDNSGNNLFAKKDPDGFAGSAYQKELQQKRAEVEKKEKESQAKERARKDTGKAEPTAAEIKAAEAKIKTENEEADKKAVEDATGTSFLERIGNHVMTDIAQMFNTPGPDQVKIKTYGEWKIKGYNGGEGNDGESVFPIFKNRDAIANILNGKAATEPAAEDGTSSLAGAEIDMKCIGFGGLKNGYTMRLKDMPFGLKDRGYFQLTEIGHSVDATKWEISVKAKWRVVRKPVGN